MRYLIIILTFLHSFNLMSQCISDETCTISPAFPNICPIQLPDATVGELYSSDLTFWMPVQFEAEGFTVNFDQLVVTQISKLLYDIESLKEFENLQDIVDAHMKKRDE